MSKTYVYDGQEAKLTGRVAFKKARDSKLIKSKNKGWRGPKVVEIKILPDPNAADTKAWKKWVKEAELYEIEEGSDPELLEEHPTPPSNERLEE